jgi:hypothetical protein
MSFMLSITNKPYMLSVIMQNVVMLSAVKLNVVAPEKGIIRDENSQSSSSSCLRLRHIDFISRLRQSMHDEMF